MLGSLKKARSSFRWFLPCLFFLTSQVQARSIYLNGKDISSARDQELHNVEVKIDGTGNIFLEAPHYQVSEEARYTPLSSWVPRSTTHSPPDAKMQNPSQPDGLEHERFSGKSKIPVEPVDFGLEPASPSEVVTPKVEGMERSSPPKLISKGGGP